MTDLKALSERLEAHATALTNLSDYHETVELMSYGDEIAMLREAASALAEAQQEIDRLTQAETDEHLRKEHVTRLWIDERKRAIAAEADRRLGETVRKMRQDIADAAAAPMRTATIWTLENLLAAIDAKETT